MTGITPTGDVELYDHEMEAYQAEVNNMEEQIAKHIRFINDMPRTISVEQDRAANDMLIAMVGYSVYLKKFMVAFRERN